MPSDPSKDYYFMQRNTGNTESLTVEYGFLDSKGDDVNQLKNNWQNYAEAVVRAIMEYLNLTYIPIGNSEYYTVQKGDTLWNISKKYNVSVADIKTANGLSSSTLKIGQKLKIPVEEEIIKENVYVVKKGDTLYKIAQNYDITVNEIIKLNNLTNTTLSVGQILEIPRKELNNSNTYIVQKGDTLYKIASNNNVTVDEIKEFNNLTSNLLSIGQELKIPSIEKYYTVQKGDTLYSIAKKNGLSIEEIINLNSLPSTILSIGQKLKLN